MRRAAITNDATAERFFEQSVAAFEQAVSQTRVREWTGLLAGLPVRLRIAGDVCYPLVTRALAHLATPLASSAELTVRVWDTASTGHEMASPPWPREAFGPHGLVQGFNDTRFMTAYDLGTHALSLLDEGGGQALFWTQDATTLPPWEHAAPLKRILHRWLRSRGLQLAHAAAVGLSSGGALIVGKSGSGKSTTALHLLREGFGYIGDDYVVLARSPQPTAHSLYCTAKLRDATRTRYPHLLPAFDTPASPALPKVVAFMQAERDGPLLGDTPVQAVFLPTITHFRDSWIEPVSAAEALAAIAPSTILQLPGAGQTDLTQLAEFIRLTRTYRLHLGTDLPGVAALIRTTLEEAGA